MRTLGLTEMQRRFVAEYRGDGDGLRAARAAGFTGSDATLKVRASKLLKHPGVAAALSQKYSAMKQARAAAAPKGAKIGSLAERLELLMAIARDRKVHPRDRTKAIAVAGELAGERGRGRFDPVPVPTPVPAEEAPVDGDKPEVRMPARLIVVDGGGSRG